jgi:tetratricopeptide (TPR) repeat protein
MNFVRIWQETVSIPTYAVGRPNKNPMFLEHRVYQGSSGRVYPHPVIDTVADEKQPRDYTALCLENEYLYVMVLPELGGRVQRALDKTNGYDFVYYNHVVKPAMVGLAGPWISGGIEFNWPQHHRPSTFDPVNWRIVENPDGSASVIVGEIETMFRTKGLSRITLYPGKAYLEIQNQLFNRTAQPQTFLWWANPAVAVGDHTRSIFPPDVHAVMDHGKRDVSDFPIAHGVYYKTDYRTGVDISRYRNIPVPTSYMAARSEEDFIGNYDDALKAGMLHVADHHISPGKKQWTWGNSEFGQAWDRNLTDSDGPYIELMTGCFTDNQPDFSFLMPCEEKRFTQYFMPYKLVGTVKKATRDLVLGLDDETGEKTLRLYATSPQTLRIVVNRGQDELLNEVVEVTPTKALRRALPEAYGVCTVTVYGTSGAVLMTYRETVPQKEPLPSPAEAIPLPGEVSDCDKLLRYGTHIEQYRHATRDAADYYREGLRREPGHCALNNAYGKLLFSRGLVAQSIDSFRRALVSAAEKNPNPYDGEYSYNLGAALDLIGRQNEAYEAFFKAAWNAAWQGAAFYRVACIDMRRGEYEKAEEHLAASLAHGGHNGLARNALAILMRETGRREEALNVVRETLRIDPLDALAARELCLSTNTGGSWESVVHADANVNPLIEIALEYARCGAAADGAEVLRGGLRCAPSLLLCVHLFAMTGDNAWLDKGKTLSPDACFPHRQEDCIALEKALEARPEWAGAHYAAGNYWYDKRQYDAAIRHWEQAAHDAPGFPTTHRNLALAYYNRHGDASAALRELSLAYQCDPGDARVLMELDTLRSKLQHSPASRIKELETGMSLVRSRDDLSLAYASLLGMLGRYQESLDFINSRIFHPWEGGEGKVPMLWRNCLIMLARRDMKQGLWAQAIERLRMSSGPYPHHLGEGRLPAARENDAWYWLGHCYQAMNDAKKAQSAFEKAAAGDTTPAGMLYYNDQPPEMILYQGLAVKALGRAQEAAAIMQKLRGYAAQHRNDHVTIEYFAVSLPDLQVFEDDLDNKNRIHCLLMDALGLLGTDDFEAAEGALRKLNELEPYHAGADIHGWRLIQDLDKLKESVI